jgi:hypothetical protein
MQPQLFKLNVKVSTPQSNGRTFSGAKLARLNTTTHRDHIALRWRAGWACSERQPWPSGGYRNERAPHASEASQSARARGAGPPPAGNANTKHDEIEYAGLPVTLMPSDLCIRKA